MLLDLTLNSKKTDRKKFTSFHEQRKNKNDRPSHLLTLKRQKINGKKSEAERKLFLLILDGAIADTDTNSEDYQ
jgi:hypothetical protein